MSVDVSKEWIAEYSQKGALWIHDGNPKRPHALLTSGLHSDGFFNSSLVCEDPNCLDRAAEDLMGLLEDAGCQRHSVDRVIGPAMGAITLAHDLARQISFVPSTCLTAYVEKVEGSPQKAMKLARTSLKPGERVILTEDVLTTGGSVERAAEAVEAAGGIVLPWIAILVNRSGLSEVGGRKIVALIDRKMSSWKAEECPLCAQGSSAIKPKDKANWVLLTATYLS